MREQHATGPRGRVRVGRRGPAGNHERHLRPAAAEAPNLPKRVGSDHEIDRAFLDWFDARLASDRPDVRDVDVLDYLVALALYDRTWASGSEH
ncbi:MAG: hypothetical protein JO039_03345 [Solirubrobacterales bacterium]|nr:hypothetical protein [Solirubrobacterales bacterium]